MKEVKKKLQISIAALLFVLCLGFMGNSQTVYAGTFDNAKTFYNKYGSQIVFKDGYFYFATKGKKASSSVSTTHWGVVGYRMRVTTTSKSVYLYYSLSGSNILEISEVNSDGYVYILSRISLSSMKSKLSSKNTTCYKEFLEDGGEILVDNCMITIKIDAYGNKTLSGSMNSSGEFSGKVYTDYDGIANAAPWSNPSSLHSYFNITINYETALRTKQIVYVRYQNADGSYGDYKKVVNRYFVYGETVSWSRDADDCYQKASVSYKVTKAKETYLDINRKTYVQKVYARYMDSKGVYGEYQLIKSQSLRYGQEFSWNYAGDVCYNSASISSYKVTKAKNNYIDISRKKYTVSISRGTGIESVTGNGSYYYGATCSANAVVKKGYTWKNWTGDQKSESQKITFTITGNLSLTANARANVYYIVFHPNGGSGTMSKMTCYYDQTYTLPSMSFKYPEQECIYIGWNRNANSFEKEYSEKEKISNLTSTDGYTFHFYTIWDYAPELVTKTRYFTLYEAQNGIITEEELLRTAGTTDREDGTTDISLNDFSTAVFTQMEKSGFEEVEYITTDSRGNITKEKAVVTVVDTSDTLAGKMDDDGNRQYVRFVNRRYWKNAKELGGLENTSLWKNESSYANVLQKAMDNDFSTVVEAWTFKKEEIEEVKDYVRKYGLGNTREEHELSRFVDTFIACKH